MDRIEQLMRDAKPRVGAPGAESGSDSARSIVFSTDPNVVLLAGRTPARRNAVRTAAATVLAAAAIVGAVVVGGNLMPQPAPGPAQTGIPAPTVSASAIAGVPNPVRCLTSRPVVSHESESCRFEHRRGRMHPGQH